MEKRMETLPTNDPASIDQRSDLRPVITPENPANVQEQIEELEKTIQKHIEKLKAKEISESAYGKMGFVASVDGVEITPDLVEEEKSKLQQLKSTVPVKQKKNLLGNIRHLFLGF